MLGVVEYRWIPLMSVSSFASDDVGPLLGDM